MPIPDPHTGITVMKAVGTYVTREEAEAVRAEMMKRPATPYQDSTLQDCFRMFKESREYKGRSDKARELYDIAWKYLRPLWHFKIAALYAQDFQNILDKMADNGLSQSMLEKERTLISKLYRTAIGWRVVDANLASVLKVEGRKSPEREIFTDEQVTLILSQKDTPTGQMVIALLACGVRIYELLHFKHEDFYRTESGAYLIGGCKTGWTRTNDGNTLSTPYFWRLTVHIALLVSIFDNAPLIFLRADWISVDITGTCCLAECRADTACKFREVIRLGETLIRHLHISCIHIIIPLRHEVIQRTTGRHTGNHLAILAKRHTTVHTTCRLFALFFH